MELWKSLAIAHKTLAARLAKEPCEMEVRHLRYFIAVAEELHLARAAQRLHIEQSPLSRVIKNLEHLLGVKLFDRTTRSTRLTLAGQVFLDEARHVLFSLQRAIASAKAAAKGYRVRLRIALSDDIDPVRLSALLAQCREEDSDVEVRLFEVPLTQQLVGLRYGLYDAGFSQALDEPDGIVSQIAWSDSLVVALPSRHPLLAHKHIPIEEMRRYPLIQCHPQNCEGSHRQIQHYLRTLGVEPIISEQVATFDLMMVFVAAGFGVGLANESHANACRHLDVVTRPLSGGRAVVTRLMRLDTEPSAPLRRFLDRVVSLDACTDSST